MAGKKWIKELAGTLLGPALWIALLLIAASRTQGGVAATDFDPEPAKRSVVERRDRAIVNWQPLRRFDGVPAAPLLPISRELQCRAELTNVRQ
jgi:hypothetical protein